MPDKYRITLSDGRVFDVVTEGGPPTEADVLANLPRTEPKKSSADPSIPTVGMALSGAAKLAKPIAAGLEEFATNPNVAAKAAKVGQVIGGLTSLPAGLSGFGDVSRGVWAGGKSGWFTGKLAQKMVAPLATAAEAVAPIAEAVSMPLSMMSAESEVLNRLNDPTELEALQQRLSGHSPSDRQPDFIDTLNKWFGTVKAAQQVAPNTVLSADEIKKLNKLIDSGVPVPIATQTVLQLRGQH